MAITIKSPTDLKLIAGALHDARFTADGVCFDAAARTFTLKCWVLEPKEFAGSLSAQFEQGRIDSAQKVKPFETCLLFFSCLWRRLVKGVAANGTRPWKACHLSFANVADSKVNVKEKVGYYELATIRFSERNHKLDLVTHYAIEISLAVGQLDGLLTETSETRDRWD